ncbi:GMP synthase (glutamine-hydrolysing) [Labedella gwakjiensis]|uniref:GMP synthase (Glutamine-hydrolysing) n=1 Tax=Labedella gwakjiensis TaxID=390269 RepID=A0A2P8GT06_9MICO|nr:gamma-glutamyl-gamma-aminobutyrate hydrolase family protein [Labedella gwakjiensis]PSL37084.1 GMP synthase (glutamine-hydrolysing) [Labedella gwakjiensis]RUQ82011.1 glutamine amidotransferase [Labedella gwakjiensis]
MMRALAIRHFDAGGLGNLEPVLVERGYDVTVIDATAASVTAAAHESWDLVVVLGSEHAVYEDHDYIAPELDLVRDRLEREAPTLGICFGAQIMAAAAGGSVHRGAAGSEIGFAVVEPSDAGLSSPLRHVVGVPVCEWHGDTFTLPPSISSLASTGRYSNQAFSVGATAFAVQFHPELTPSMFDRWIAEGLGSLATEGVDPEWLRAEGAAHLEAATAASRRMFGEFLDGLPPVRANAEGMPGDLSATR